MAVYHVPVPITAHSGKGLPQEEKSVSSTHQKEVGPLPARGQGKAVAGGDVARGTDGMLGVYRCPGVPGFNAARARTG